MLDEYGTDQMIHLVLNAHREQIGGLQLERYAVRVVRLDHHVRRPFHSVVVAGHRQAAFLADNFAIGHDDLRIDEDFQVALILGHIDHDHPLVHVHLGRGQADAGSLIHRVRHIIHQLFDRRGELSDGGCDAF